MVISDDFAQLYTGFWGRQLCLLPHSALLEEILSFQEVFTCLAFDFLSIAH